MEGNNPAADPLREILTRYGAQTAPAAPPALPAPVPLAQTGPMGGPPAASRAAPIQQQALPAPRR